MMTILIRLTLLLSIMIMTTNNFGTNRKTNLSDPTNSKSFTVETIGEGRPILYLPGFATPGSIWKETIESLNLERKAHLFSYAGFNGNAPIKMPWYSNIKNSIIEYIRDNDMSDIIIIGHSVGGNLAVDIAAAIPNKVSKIVIVDALPCMREVMMPNVPADSLYYDSPYNKQLLAMDMQQFKNTATLMASNMTLKEDKKGLITNWILEADRQTWVYGYTDILKLDLRNSLSKLTCKTLILGASFPNVKRAKEIYDNQYSNLSNKTIIMATNSKHYLMFDQPQWFHKTVKDFLLDGEK